MMYTRNTAKGKYTVPQTGFCIFIDADSFPSASRDLIIRMAQKRQWQCCFAANRPLPIKSDPSIRMVIVPAGKNMADRYIGFHASIYDIVLTRDILLAERLVKNNITVINHLGEIFDQGNIAERRSVRDFSFHAHQYGLIKPSQGKSDYGQKELAHLANSLDRMMSVLMKKKPMLKEKQNDSKRRSRCDF